MGRNYFLLSGIAPLSMNHTASIQVRKNRIKLHVSRILVSVGLFIIAYDYYLTYFTPFWDFDLLLGLFILGCVLVLSGFTGKLWRRGTSRYQKPNYTRHGKCNNCGACCKMPVRCVFLMNNKCNIHHNRPVQCRTFPAKPEEMISKNCGYYFELIS